MKLAVDLRAAAIGLLVDRPVEMTKRLIYQRFAASFSVLPSAAFLTSDEKTNGSPLYRNKRVALDNYADFYVGLGFPAKEAHDLAKDHWLAIKLLEDPTSNPADKAKLELELAQFDIPYTLPAQRAEKKAVKVTVFASAEEAEKFIKEREPVPRDRLMIQAVKLKSVPQIIAERKKANDADPAS